MKKWCPAVSGALLFCQNCLNPVFRLKIYEAERMTMKKALLRLLYRNVSAKRFRAFLVLWSLFMALAALKIASILSGAQYLEVKINEQTIGYMKSEAEYSFLLEQAKESVAKGLNVDIGSLTIDESAEASFKPVYLDKKSAPAAQAYSEPSDMPSPGQDQIKEVLLEALSSCMIKGSVFSIYIDGKYTASLSTIEAAREVLMSFSRHYAPETSSPYVGRFLGDIEIIEETVAEGSERKIESEEEAFCRLLTKEPGALVYETVHTEEVLMQIDFECIEKPSDDYYLGQRRVLEEGEAGERLATVEVTIQNGKTVASAELSSVTIKEPVDLLVVNGTRLLKEGEGPYVGKSDRVIEDAGCGALCRPLDTFALSRSVSAGHGGADMIAERGSPIYAAEAGEVVFSDHYGGYGNLLVIDHGERLLTYYAHLDTFNVKKGERVLRGQQVATVGTTGKSSAYHLHFEVREKGAVKDPLPWIE